MSKVVTFRYSNTEYLITYEGEKVYKMPQWYRDQLQHCVDTNDFITLNNKITAGLAWGYMERLSPIEEKFMPEKDNYEDPIL